MKLTIELVPNTSWGNNIRALMTKRQWNALRGMICDRAWGTCVICGNSEQSLECHEVWSYNEKTQIQKLTGLLALCPNCHMVKHFGLARVQGKQDEASKHLRKVNGLNKQQAEDYVKEAFRIWRDRNQYYWTLDLSYLKRYGIDPEKLKAPNE